MDALVCMFFLVLEKTVGNTIVHFANERQSFLMNMTKTSQAEGQSQEEYSLDIEG